MPELPEVETVRISLEPLILGATILSISERTSGVLQNWTGQPDPADGRTVTGLRRRGKYLLVDLGPDLLLVAHLRMTGQFRYEESLPAWQSRVPGQSGWFFTIRAGLAASGCCHRKKPTSSRVSLNWDRSRWTPGSTARPCGCAWPGMPGHP